LEKEKCGNVVLRNVEECFIQIKQFDAIILECTQQTQSKDGKHQCDVCDRDGNEEMKEEREIGNENSSNRFNPNPILNPNLSCNHSRNYRHRYETRNNGEMRHQKDIIINEKQDAIMH
jgi:hypothetical protein